MSKSLPVVTNMALFMKLWTWVSKTLTNKRYMLRPSTAIQLKAFKAKKWKSPARMLQVTVGIESLSNDATNRKHM